MPGHKRHHRRGRRIPIILLVVLAVLVGAGFVLFKVVRYNPAREFRESAKAAHEALSAGNYSEARLLLTRLVSENPQHLRLRLQLTDCLLWMDNPAEAEKVARETIELDSEYAPAYALLAKALRKQGDHEGAIEAARSATRGRDVSEYAHQILAELMIGVGLGSQGLKELSSAMDAGEADEAGALRLATAFAEVEDPSGVGAIRARRRLALQLERLRDQVESDPADAEAVCNLARLALLAGEPGIATTALVGVRVHRELTPGETFLLARAYAAAGNPARARELLDETEASAAGDDGRSRILARIEAGDPDRALADLRDLPEEVGESIPILKLRLEALRLKGETLRDGPEPGAADAIAAALDQVATRILEHRPLDERARESRAVARLALGRPALALEDAAALEQNSPDLDSGPWLHGLAALELGLHDTGLALLLKARPESVDPVSARWIARAALKAGDLPVMSRMEPLLAEHGNGALRCLLALARGAIRRAVELTRGAPFRSSPVVEQFEAASGLLAVGRAGPAEALIDRLHGEATAHYRAALLRSLGRREEAELALREIAATGGPRALRAMTRLAETALAKGEAGRAEYEELLALMRNLPESASSVDLLMGREALAAGDPAAALEFANRSLEARNRNPQALALRFDALLAKGAKPEELDAAAGLVLVVAPGYRPARRHRAAALAERGRAKLRSRELLTATEDLNEAVRLLPGAGPVRYFRGMALLGTGELDIVAQDAALLIENEKSAAAGHLLMGMVHLSRGRSRLAADSCRKAVALAPGAKDAVFVSGLALLRAGETAEALGQAKRLLELEPDSKRSLWLHASALAASGDRAGAEKLLRAETTRDESDLGSLLLLGRQLLAAKRSEDAAEVFRQAVSVSPQSASARVHLVSALLETGDDQAALQAAVDTGKVEGREGLSHLLRYACLRRAGARTQASAALRAAVRAEPDHPVALELMGEDLLRKGDLAGGRRLLLRTAEIAPRNIRVRMQLGLLAQIAGDDAEARDWYEQALVRRPGHAPAANNLAVLLTADPDTTGRAVELARRAVGAAPKNGSYHDTLAAALSADGRHEEAVAAAQQAMKLLPDSATILLGAAEVYRNANRIREARALAEQAVKKAGPTEQEAVQSRVREFKEATEGK